MLNIFKYCLLFLLLINTSFAYKTFKDVIVADDSNFEDLIHEKGKYTFINFYSKQCIHCQKLAPNFQILTQLFNNSKIQIAQLEGRENKRIRKKESIAGFPTLRLYAFDGTHLGSYNGDRSIEDMADFVNSHTAFIAPWLENWVGKYSFIERLASKLSNVRFIKVDATSEEATELTSLYKIDKFPTILHFNSHDSLTNFRILEINKDIDIIDGPTIEEFLNNQIGQAYDSIENLEIVKGEDAEQQDVQLKRGFNFDVQKKTTPEQEEEAYKRLREL
ncbi:unnamed protein product [Wickerhamomyces anomalus]